ncbi:hypothetical protein SAMN05216559_1243 [Halomicrobium zhouii]|uniref:RCK C-terminal domain-containing protein n=1 Tax=Halomicrobium zhouii TaxID=767519 RepID=A0A1I6KPT9_9EURY|nr:TrkA C-terminal domain-containing protein [Halomicrobium zhouii]SFR93214.1 hypothetical protein SAMN05216559_1243 [Halomicrobium zhouii]
MSLPPAEAVAQLGGPTTEGVTVTLAGVLGVAVFAGVVAGSVALAYRWYVRERVPTGLSLLAGLAVVAVSLSTTTLLAEEISPDGRDIVLATALVHVAAFLTSGLAATAGTRFGDRLGVDLFAATGVSDVDADVSEIVQTVGRVTTVQLPDEVADIVGYDPVTEETKETLAGRRFLFPRRLTKAELRERLVSRLRTDYGVGHVDVEVGDDGSVSFLAVGSRAAGIGPTLPPATNAVAIRADPAHAASAGDLVQVWETDPLKRVLTGELRGVAGDVVTVAIDAADTPKLNPADRYKLVTLPVQDRPDREFASLLRSADETLATVTVEGGSDLDGVTVDALDVTVAAITRTDERPEPLPARNRALQPGDVVYAIATPENLRKVEAAGRGPEGGVTDTVSERSEPVETANDSDESPDEEQAETASEEAPDPAAELDDGDDTDGGSGEGEGDGHDAPSAELSNGEDDESLLDGDAFADTDDLPGMDRELDVPDASVGQGTATDDEQVDDATDASGGDVDEQTADGQSDDKAVEEPADDDAVPFTPLDVGEDDPLADPLLGGGEGDGPDSDGRPDDDGDAVPDDEDGVSDGKTDDRDGDDDHDR